MSKLSAQLWLAVVLIAGNAVCCFAATESNQPLSALDSVDQASIIGTEYSINRTLSLQQCFDQADKNNKEIRIALSRMSLAQAAIVIAKAIPNPSYNMTYGWGPAWDYIVAGNNQQVGFTEEIQVAGRRTKKEGVAASAYLQTALQVEATRFDIHNRIRRAYAALAGSTSFARLLVAQKNISVQLVKVSDDKSDTRMGISTQLRGKLMAFQFDAQINTARSKVIQDSAQLAQLLGETPLHEEIIGVENQDIFNPSNASNEMVPSADRALPSLEKLLPTAWSQRSDLKAAVQQAYNHRKALTLAKTQRIPDPTIGANYLFTAYNPQQRQDFFPTGTGNFTDPTNRVPQQPAFLLTVSEETPLYYQYQGQVAQAKATWERQLKQNEAQRAQIANDLVVAYEGLVAARNIVAKFQDQLIPESQKVASLSQAGYRSGRSNLATAVLAQNQYQQIRGAYFNSVVLYQNAWADLERAVGLPLKL